MILIDQMKNFKIYKTPTFLPTLEKDKKKKSAIVLLTPDYNSSKSLMNHPLFVNKKRFESYYAERDVSYYIGNKKIEEVTDESTSLLETKRSNLKDSDFGIPEDRKFPLDTEQHVRSAIKLFGHAEESKKPALARKIASRARSYGIQIPETTQVYKYLHEDAILEKKDDINYENPMGRKYVEDRDIEILSGDAIDVEIKNSLETFDIKKNKLLLESKNIVEDYNNFIQHHFEKNVLYEMDDDEEASYSRYFVYLSKEMNGVDDSVLDRNISNSYHEMNDPEMIKKVTTLRIKYIEGINSILKKMISNNGKLLGLNSKEIERLVQGLSSDDTSNKSVKEIKELILNDRKKYIKDDIIMDLRPLGAGVFVGSEDDKDHKLRSEESIKKAIQLCLTYDLVLHAHGGSSYEIDISRTSKAINTALDSIANSLTSYFGKSKKELPKSIIEYSKDLNILSGRLMLALVDLIKHDKVTELKYDDNFKNRLNKIYTGNGLATSFKSYISSFSDEEQEELDHRMFVLARKYFNMIKDILDKADITGCKETSNGKYVFTFDVAKGGSKKWDFDIEYLDGKRYNSVKEVLKMAKSQGFDKILVKSCNPEGLNLPKDLTKNVTFGHHTIYKESFIESDLDFLDEDFRNLIRDTENNYRIIAEAYGIDYDNNVILNEYYQEISSMSDDELISEAILADAVEKVAEFIKKVIGFIIGLVKKFINAIKNLLIKVHDLITGRNQAKIKKSPIKASFIVVNDDTASISKPVELESQSQLEKIYNDNIKTLVSAMKSNSDKQVKLHEEEKNRCEALMDKSTKESFSYREFNEEYSGIKNVIFDIGGVLVDDIDQTQALMDADIPVYYIDKYIDNYWNKLHADSADVVSAKIAFTAMCDDEEMKAYAPKAFYILSSCIKPLEYVDKMLSLLKMKGYNLYYLSNWSKYSFDLCVAQGKMNFLKYFDDGIVSFQVGFQKPDKSIYEIFKEKFYIDDPSECIFFDNREENVEAARSCGIEAVKWDIVEGFGYVLNNLIVDSVNEGFFSKEYSKKEIEGFADKCRDDISEYVSENKYLHIKKDNKAYITTRDNMYHITIAQFDIDAFQKDEDRKGNADKVVRGMCNNISKLLKGKDEFKIFKIGTSRSSGAHGYGKYNIDLLYKKDIELTEVTNVFINEAVEDGHKYYLVSDNYLGDNKKVKPSIPKGSLDEKTERIRLYKTINGAMMAKGDKEVNTGRELFVHVPVDEDSIKVSTPSLSQVPNMNLTGEVWVKEEIAVKCIGKIRVGKPVKQYSYKLGDKDVTCHSWQYSWLTSQDKHVVDESAKSDNIITLDMNDPKAKKYLESNSYTKKYLDYLAENTGEILVDADKDKMVGYIFVGKKKDKGFISTLEVVKAYRGNGYGAKLLNDAIHKYGAIDLCVDKTNKLAYEMYKHHGFKVVDDTVKNGKQYYMKLG